jgi:alkylated DNA repair dioxygenase AlkB
MDNNTGYRELHKDISIYRQFLDINDQIKMINELPEYFSLLDTNGDYNYPDKNGNKKGRCFRKASECPPSVIAQFGRIKSVMEPHNKSFVYDDFTHVLLNAYPTVVGMSWHQDSVGRHDGDKNAPVYTLSLGNDAEFIYRFTQKGIDNHIVLHSGDLLVFGGSLRNMFHCVKRVITDTFPGYNIRYNLTFRTCSQLTDEEYMNAQTETYNNKKLDEFNKSRSERRKLYELGNNI